MKKKRHSKHSFTIRNARDWTLNTFQYNTLLQQKERERERTKKEEEKYSFVLTSLPDVRARLCLPAVLESASSSSSSSWTFSSQRRSYKRGRTRTSRANKRKWWLQISTFCFHCCFRCKIIQNRLWRTRYILFFVSICRCVWQSSNRKKKAEFYSALIDSIRYLLIRWWWWYRWCCQKGFC